MLPADWAEYVAQAEREIKKSPNPPKRRQPRVTRHKSRRQRIAESQTKNPVRAAYTTESKYNVTPTMPEKWRGTNSPGETMAAAYRSGKATIEPPVGYSKVTPRKGHGRRGPKTTSADLDALTKEYGG